MGGAFNPGLNAVRPRGPPFQFTLERHPPMAVFEPATQPTNVTTSGHTATVLIGPAYRQYPLRRLIVVQTSGDAASYTVECSTDPDVAALAKTVVKAEDCTATDPCDVDNHGRGYAWDTEDSSGNLYVKIVPSSGSNNNYTVRLHHYGGV